MPRDPASRSKGESRRERETQYPDDGYNDRGTPSSPETQTNYTTDHPHYGNVTNRPSTYAASSIYPAPSNYTTPPAHSSTGYTSQYGGNPTSDTPATYTASGSHYGGSQMSDGVATYLTTTTPASISTWSSYTPGTSQTTQPQVYPYATGTANSTSYGASPSYTQPPGSYYGTSQSSMTNNPPSQYALQSPDSAAPHAREPEQHIPVPVTIQQCGCIGCDVDGTPDDRPRLKDGKKEQRRASSSSKRSEPSRSKHPSSSKKIESSKSKALSTSETFEIRPATINKQNGNMNCGALYLHNIKPWAEPQRPPEGASREEEEVYEALSKKWREESKAWLDTSCPCRYGYFNTNGHWVAGSYVRKYLKEGHDAEGASPPNPRWRSNKWKAPEQPDERKKG